ncbi:MAG: hypothetical protein NC913_01235, partial [Candidatus Omnitrophica bacterium]|nr:hypothetical protein [Candidatus Omnitrophota bacterium]
MIEKEKKPVAFFAKPRTEKGKGASRSLRRNGFIPGVVYGPGEE